MLTGCPGDDHASDDEVGESAAGSDGVGATESDGDGELNCGVTASGGSAEPFAGWASVEVVLDKLGCPNFAATLDLEMKPFTAFAVKFLFPVGQGGSIPQSGEYPLLIFQHGNLQRAKHYGHYWDALVPEGMFVANLDTIESSGFEGRIGWFQCAIEYFGSQWPDPTFLAENPTWPADAVLDSRLVLAGHSMSGEAALQVAAQIVSNPSEAYGFDLQGLITLASRENESAGFKLPPSMSVDYLGIAGSIDNDVPNGALRLHELAGDDQSSLPDPGASKTLVWAYDVHHNEFGGVNDQVVSIGDGTHHGVLDSWQMHAKGQAVAVPYVLAFLRRLWFDSTDEADLALLRGESLAEEVYNPEWWEYLDASDDGNPVIRVSHVEGCEAERIVIDDFAREPMASLSPSSEDFNVLVAGDLSTVAVLPLVNVLYSHEHTSVLDVAWQDGESGSITWDLSGLDTSAATHLSFRVANVVDIEQSMAGTCVVHSIFPELEFKVVLVDDALATHTVFVVPPAQDYETVGWAHGANTKICSVGNMMSEVLVPLGEACTVFPIRRVRLEFGGVAGGGHVYVDSLELRSRGVESGCP